MRMAQVNAKFGFGAAPQTVEEAPARLRFAAVEHEAVPGPAGGTPDPNVPPDRGTYLGTKTEANGLEVEVRQASRPGPEDHPARERAAKVLKDHDLPVQGVDYSIRGSQFKARSYEPMQGPQSRHQWTKHSRIQNLQEWHKQLAEFRIMNPTAKLADLANWSGRSQSWIGAIMQTDAFQEYYAQRLAKHQEMVSISVVNEIQDTALAGLRAMKTKMQPTLLANTPLGEVASATETVLKALGYGHKHGPATLSLTLNNGDGKSLKAEGSMLSSARTKMEVVMEANTHRTKDMVEPAALQDPAEHSPRVEDAEVIDAGEA